MILPGRENPRKCVDPDEMEMRRCLSNPGSPKYVLPVAQFTSVTPVSPYTRHRSLTMYLEAVIDRVEGCTLRRWSSKFGDALLGRDGAGLKMHFEAAIEWVWRYALGVRDLANLKAVILHVWRYTWRPWSIEIGGVLGGSRFGGGRSGGRCDGDWDSIHWLTRNRGNVESWEQSGPPWDESWLAAWDSWSWNDAVLDVCSTRCMQYSVYAVLGVCSTRR